ncbi:MAG: hypothetical protein R3225_03170 [Halofilum sp. (in: g-proteobacteria)]|nr:hypothetical protein [Halofilum sp. (in: g-proteobacteria)]
MLREIPATRQRHDEPARRWFTDERMDLTVWQDRAGEVIAFQLAYDRLDGERALEWHRGTGFRHHRVDDGETETGRHKQTPLLIPDGAIPRDRLLAEFRRRAAGLDESLREVVIEALAGLPPQA